MRLIGELTSIGFDRKRQPEGLNDFLLSTELLEIDGVLGHSLFLGHRFSSSQDPGGLFPARAVKQLCLVIPDQVAVRSIVQKTGQLCGGANNGCGHYMEKSWIVDLIHLQMVLGDLLLDITDSSTMHQSIVAESAAWFFIDFVFLLTIFSLMAPAQADLASRGLLSSFSRGFLVHLQPRVAADQSKDPATNSWSVLFDT